MRAFHSLVVTSLCAATLGVAVPAFAQQTASGMAPASASSVANTGVNKRDRNSQRMTPFDQPNDKADVSLAAAVRQAIYKDKSLSMSAHNLKLIAAKGVVTLRGPVASAEEKSRVESTVKAVAGVSSVDNQLDAKN